MKGFGIYVKNELIDPKHVESMGVSVWLYFWFLDKMTSISEEGIGLVLGGKPIVYEDIRLELGLSESTYSRWIRILKKGGYINVIRTPRGLRISVNKAEKRFGQKSKGKSDTSKMTHHSDTSNMDERSPLLTERSPYMTDANKDNTEDNTEDFSAATAAPPSKRPQKKDPEEPISREQFVESCKASPQRHIQIIGEWAEAEGPTYTRRGQWESFLTRNLRAARGLAAFKTGEIEKAYHSMMQDLVREENGRKVGFLTKYTLETVGKYV